MDFTPLEHAALLTIFTETPEFADSLRYQLEGASVENRENTGAGFFTTITVPASSERVACPTVLGNRTHTRVYGLKYGLGFVLFMQDGRLHLLEGYSCGDDDTTNLPLFGLTFQITETPF
jgi:hypothetical protein